MFGQNRDGHLLCMAENQIRIDAPPERVFAVLSDASLYGDWVLGAQAVRDADAAFPDPGTELHHRTGIGPVTIDDTTEVLESHPPTRLVLRANLSRFGSMRIDLQLEPAGNGTSLTMQEEPESGALAVAGRLTDPSIAARNALSLRRLKQLAETP